jgi:hypothetical protein
MITAILLNWKRPENLPYIIKALRGQSVDVRIVLINSVGGSQETFGLDRVVSLPWNFGPVARLLVASQIGAGYVLLQDDDLMAGYADLVAETLESCKEHGLVGAWGRGVKDLQYRPEIHRGPAAIIKTRWAMLPAEMLAEVRMPPKEARFADDLWLSLELGKGEPAHFVDSNLRGGLLELPAGDVGLDRRPDHYESRDEFVEWYLGKVRV